MGCRILCLEEPVGDPDIREELKAAKTENASQLNVLISQEHSAYLKTTLVYTSFLLTFPCFQELVQ